MIPNWPNFSLVGGLEHDLYFSIQLGIMIPIDFHIFQRGRSTTNQITLVVCLNCDHSVGFMLVNNPMRVGEPMRIPNVICWKTSVFVYTPI